MSRKQQKWNTVKAKICLTFGTIRDAAAALKVTPEAMRLAVNSNKCPRVRRKLIEAELLDAA